MTLRVLYVLPYVPSPIRVRPYEIIRHLAQAGCRVTVAALSDGSPADAAALSELQSVCESVHCVPHPKWRAAAQALAALPTPTPLWAAWCHSSEMDRLLRRLIASERFDVAHIEHLRAAHFASAMGDLPCVFDSVDCLTDLRDQMRTMAASLPSRLVSWEEWAKLRHYEPRVCNGFRQVAVTSRHDAEALAALGVTVPITVIPNGVDEKRFQPAPGTPSRWSLVFSGKMSYAPNDDAARFLLEQVLPRIDALMPTGAEVRSVTVCIAGSGPGKRLKRAAARWGDRVTVTGYVEDLQPYLAAARVAVCPLRVGAGIQNKALEAMATGLPVVATPSVARALEGAVTAGGLRVADDAEKIARACCDWLRDPASAERAGSAARAYVETCHRWQDAAAQFLTLYEKTRLSASGIGQ